MLDSQQSRRLVAVFNAVDSPFVLPAQASPLPAPMGEVEAKADRKHSQPRTPDDGEKDEHCQLPNMYRSAMAPARAAWRMFARKSASVAS